MRKTLVRATLRVSATVAAATALGAATGLLDLPGSSTDVRAMQRTLPVLELDPGALARDETIVSFPLPPGVTGETLQLRAQNGGTVIPLQIGRDRSASFIARGLKAGAVTRYTLEPALDRAEHAASDGRSDGRSAKSGGAAAAASGLTASLQRERDGLHLRLWDQPVLSYRTDKEALPRTDIKPIYKRAGYIHPIRTPTGRIVTDDYPPNHVHHHGIWAAWTKTEFQGRTPDFWNMGSGTGTVEFESVLDSWSGRVHAGFRARHRYVDLSAPSPLTVLTEVWELSLYAAGQGKRSYRMFDLVSMQDMVTDAPLVLPEYLYGSLGFRGPRAWDGAPNTIFLTSEGKVRSNGQGTRARWCYIGGTVDGARAGVVILGHPQNFRAPQTMRIHPTEPFFNWAPTQLGRMEIAPGQSYVSRYRVIVIDGPPDVAAIERLWQDYTDPVKVRLSS